jgi:origin recognition complex subunit 5
LLTFSQISNLTVIFIISVPSPRLLYLPGAPHIHFTTYTREEALKIVVKEPPQIFLGPIEDLDYGEEEAAEDNDWLWSRYIAVVWDSIGKGASRDLKSFTAVCHKLWRPFVQPIVDGTFGTRDFSKLLVSRRTIFQGEDFLTGNKMKQKKTEQGKSVEKRIGLFFCPVWPHSSLTSAANHELPYYTKFILCAAYLASYNPSRQDKIYFMKTTERKKRKRGGAIGGRASKHRKVRTDNPDRKLPAYHISDTKTSFEPFTILA